MLTISPERITDIRSLNLEFLNLVAAADSGEVFGIANGTFQEIKTLSSAMIERIAATDILLFSLANKDSAESICDAPRPQGLPLLVERLHITARDFAREDPGLAVSYLGVNKESCTNLLRMGLTEIREASRSGSVRFIPLGTTAFRMLGALSSPSERTQYAALAAND